MAKTAVKTGRETMSDEVKARLREASERKKLTILRNVSSVALMAMARDHFDETVGSERMDANGIPVPLAYLSYVDSDQVIMLSTIIPFWDVIVASRVGNRVVRAFSHARLQFALQKLGIKAEKNLRPMHGDNAKVVFATEENVKLYKPTALFAQANREDL